MPDPADAAALPAVSRPAPRAPRRSEDAIGAPLKEVRAQLLGILDRLEGVLGEHAAPLLEEAKRQLNERSCRIAVIGNVKVGKSTLLNALAERPGLLPSDSDPWSAVVCALHFHDAAHPPEHPAAFHLFSADDWQRLGEGGGRVRELTEHLLPGFAPELLRAQLAVMRQRAKRRLGGQFEALLGQSHRFRELTSELIAAYVNGADHAPKASGDRMLYADITRAADLYFSDGPFAFPCTLIDTPGTNGPFLVRDEITRRSLADVDIVVCVISALQPLSRSDIALLRLLNGMHKDQIIVFINRTDQLPNPDADVLRVKAAVEQCLAAEFPALCIPVICGSARLASLLVQQHGAETVAAPEPSQPEDAARVPLVDRSGVRELRVAIGNNMCASGIAMVLRQIAVCLRALLESADHADRTEIGTIEEALVARLRDAEAAGARIDEEQRSLAALEECADTLRNSFRELADHLREIVKLGASTLRTELRDSVRDFADGQADALLRALPRRRAFCCDLTPLRQQVETALLAAVARIAEELARVEKFLYPHLKVVVTGLLPQYDRQLLEAPACPLVQGPSTAALSRLATSHVEAGWWRRCLAPRRTSIERASRVRRVVQQAFLPVVEELAAEAEQHLSLRVDYTLERANAIGAGLCMGIEQRRAKLAAEQALLDSDARARFEREQCDRAAQCVARRAAYTAPREQLAKLLERLDALPGP